MDLWRRILFFGLVAAAVDAAHMVPPLSTTVLTASDGGEVTFWSRLNNNTHAILFVNNKLLLNFDNGLILSKDDMIRVEDWTRIVMTNVQMNDSNIYKLQIYEGPKEKLYHFKLNVTEASAADSGSHSGSDPGPDPGPDPGSNKTGQPLLAVYIGLPLCIVILLGLAFWKRKWIKEKLHQNQKEQNQNQKEQNQKKQNQKKQNQKKQNIEIELREVRSG